MRPFLAQHKYRFFRCIPFFVLVLVVTFLTLSPSFAENLDNAPNKPILLRFAHMQFDPLVQFPVKQELLPYLSGYADHDIGYYIVQFDGPIQAVWCNNLEKLGVQFFDYIPDFAYIIRMDSMSEQQVKAIPHVRWLGIYQPSFRISQSAVDLIYEAKKNSGTTNSTNADSINVDSTSADLKKTSSVILRISAFPCENPQIIQNKIQSLGGEILDKNISTWKISLKVRIDSVNIGQLAAIKGIRWVELMPQFKLYNDVATDIMKVNSIRNTHGLYGEGQTIAVCDTGLDKGSIDPTQLHDDFEDGMGKSRVIIIDSVDDGAQDVNSGHGTHVAGSIVGNGILSGSDPSKNFFPPTCYAGVAPKANLIFQAIEHNETGYLIGLSLDLNVLFDQAREAGAYIHSNSWGGDVGSVYSTHSQDVDEYMWEHRDFLIVFAAGNGGIDKNGDGIIDLYSMGMPATAKNCLSVGGSESNRPSGQGFDGPYGNKAFATSFMADPIFSDHVSNTSSGMAAFSARGPVLDGRYKPDLVAPCTNIISVRSSVATYSGWGEPPDDNYMYMGGTSMSTPLVSGTAALVREYLIKEKNIETPSASLLKAVLIHSANNIAPGQYSTGLTQEIPNSVPNNVEGWGQVKLDNIVNSDQNNTILFFDKQKPLATGESYTTDFEVVNSDKPLKLTLVWTDYPGSPATHGSLVNDLDLELIDALGDVHYPERALKSPTLTTLSYDYNFPYFFTCYKEKVATKFTPPTYPITLDSTTLYFKNDNSIISNVDVVVYDDDGENGLPGTELSRKTLRYIPSNWITIGTGDVTIESGNFYIALEKTNISHGVAEDFIGTDNRQYVYENAQWKPYTRSLYIRANIRNPEMQTSQDRVNNVLGMILEQPQAGTYKINITGYNVPKGPQSYAMVVSGNIKDKPLLPVLSLSLPKSATEGDGILSGQGLVSLSKVWNTGVVVKLTSSHPNDLKVPESVTIPKGKLFVSFDLHVTDDYVLDGTKNIKIFASASGLEPGEATMQVFDNDNSTTLTVGPECAYPTIQAALENASDGYTILVAEGVYSEYLKIGSQVAICSMKGYTSTIIENKYQKDHAIEIKVPNVVIKGFTIYGAPRSNKAAIRLAPEAHSCKILNNRLGYERYKNNDIGLSIQSDSNFVSGNICNANSSYGIYIYGVKDNLVINNQCNGNEKSGVFINISNFNTLRENVCNDNKENGFYLYSANSNSVIANHNINNYQRGIYLNFSDSVYVAENICNANGSYGIYVYSSNSNTLASNISNLNNSDGVYIYNSSYNSVAKNTMQENKRYGVYVHRSPSNTIMQNFFTANGQYGIMLFTSSIKNSIYLNAFSNNVAGSVYSTEENAWTSPSELLYTYNDKIFKGFLGNFFAGHKLTDSNGDGTTDNIYELSVESANDEYPLVVSGDKYKLESWWLNQDNRMYKNNTSNPTKVTVMGANSSLVWIDSGLTDKPISYSESKTWTGQIAFASTPQSGQKFTVEIGYSNDGSDFIASNVTATIQGNGKNSNFIFYSTTGDFSVPANGFLAFRLSNPNNAEMSVLTGGGWSYFCPLYKVSGVSPFYVGLSETYRTIQRASDLASSGFSIIVTDGTYKENINIEKPLTISSVNGYASTTVIAKNYKENVFTIKANNVSIKGFTVYGASNLNKAGIFVNQGSSNCVIENNRFGLDKEHANYHGVSLYGAKQVKVSNNSCNGNLRNGINVSATVESTINDNACIANDGYGIYVTSSENNIFNSNQCLLNNNSGISLYKSITNTISNSTFNANTEHGMNLYISTNNLIYKNTIQTNKDSGIYMYNACRNNVFYLNNLIKNGTNLTSRSQNIWNSPTKLKYTYKNASFENYLGNFYSDHKIQDASSDGIADTRYVMTKPEPDDTYPLTEPYDNYIISDGSPVIVQASSQLLQPQSDNIGNGADKTINADNQIGKPYEKSGDVKPNTQDNDKLSQNKVEQSERALIEFDYIPAFGNRIKNLTGNTKNVNTETYGVIVYIYASEWRIKPYSSQPVTKIRKDGTWECDITKGKNDHLATDIAAFVVPLTYKPKVSGTTQQIPRSLYRESIAHIEAIRINQDQVSISLTNIPSYANRIQPLKGEVAGVYARDYNVIVISLVNQKWEIKPYDNSPYTPILDNNKWTCDITTSGYDHLATQIIAFLVPKTYRIPNVIDDALVQKLYIDASAYTQIFRNNE